MTCEDISTGRALWADSLVHAETIFFFLVFGFVLDLKSEEVSLKVKREPTKHAACRDREPHL